MRRTFRSLTVPHWVISNAVLESQTCHSLVAGVMGQVHMSGVEQGIRLILVPAVWSQEAIKLFLGDQRVLKLIADCQEFGMRFLSPLPISSGTA
ncbi:MAG: hypothetical protein EP336_13885 [Rhodobacteraceae bacterium]|nr:MAG: hypothetical protein EP336_13885 [Paracoccaceae bacterium]